MNSSSIIDQTELESLCCSVPHLDCAPISYGVVRDYVESLEMMPRLARYQGDLKDIQRSWMIKAILSVVPLGKKLLEIGGGEPLVADVLTRIGYEVVIVDPYDGSGNGPGDFERIKADYSGIRFIRERFTPETPGLPDQCVDCCFSVSVLEHVPLNELSGVFSEISRITRPGGYSVHAVDHVLLGRGEEYHRDMLKRAGAEVGIASDEVDSVLEQAANDPETYFLSAEAHNMWRGGLSYSEFPMRRCISVQFCNVVGDTR
jgi:SAM-dependent methyltransferase